MCYGDDVIIVWPYDLYATQCNVADDPVMSVLFSRATYYVKSIWQDVRPY